MGSWLGNRAGRRCAGAKLRDHKRLDHERKWAILDIGVEVSCPNPFGDLIDKRGVLFRFGVS